MNEHHHQPVSLQTCWLQLLHLQEELLTTQTEVIRQAAQVCARCIEDGGVIHTFGSGHSRAFAAELVHRAGGLAPINRIDFEDLALYGDWPLKRVRSLECERDLTAGAALLSYHQIEPQDVFLVASQSGVNAAIVEYALQIKQRQHQLIVLTSLKHTRETPSRHPGGQMLYELADIVIDNCTNCGDTLLALPSDEQIGSASSLLGVLVAQLLNSEIVTHLQARGKDVPAFVSDNIEGGIERNLLLQQRYEKRVRYKG
ncbi:MAG TPA: sugar isomerase domain-containing protein [Ktedonobacteraceae bacterium]|nr:sugar isomerase domain-containing protein [Ktedonobacteraceae bacterium]